MSACAWFVPVGTVVAWAMIAVAPIAGQSTERVSVGIGGAQADFESGLPSVSADGRYVAFKSFASLVPADTNGRWDIYVRDRQSGTNERVSVNSAEQQADGGSDYPAISADGRYVAFASFATNLVSGDTNETQDVFVRDRQNGTTERVNVTSDEEQTLVYWTDSPSISADGRYVAFRTAFALTDGDLNGTWDVYVRDRQTGTTEGMSVNAEGSFGNDGSINASISADGRYVAFGSAATNLVSGDSNGAGDVFVRDRQSGTTERVSVGPGGVEGNSASGFSVMSADGRCVAFASYATNLVSGDPVGRDVFVHDRQSGTTELVNVDSAEAPTHYAIFLEPESISADGRYVVFHSDASDVVGGDTNGQADVFVRDRQLGTTQRVSVDSAGAQGDFSSMFASISANGRCVAFASSATNLVSGDTNGEPDVFVRDLCSDATAAAFAGDGVNADVIAAVSPLLGSSWSAPLTIGHAHGAGGALSLKVRSFAINGPTVVSPFGGRSTEVLVGGSFLAILSGSHDGSTGDITPQAIPATDFSLVGLSFAAQYVVLGGGFADYSQAVTGVIGCD